MLNRLPPDPPEIPPGETAKTRMAVLRAYGETRQSYLDEALMPIREIRAAYDEGYVELAQQRQGKEFVLMAYRRKERDRRRRPFFAARDTD